MTLHRTWLLGCVLTNACKTACFVYDLLFWQCIFRRFPFHQGSCATVSFGKGVCLMEAKYQCFS